MTRTATPVRHPLIISSRLMAALEVGDGILHLEPLSYDGSHTRYLFILDGPPPLKLANAPERVELGRNAELQVPGAEIDYTRAMASLLDFLSAAVESDVPSTDSPFSIGVLNWARRNRLELEMASCDLQVNA